MLIRLIVLLCTVAKFHAYNLSTASIFSRSASSNDNVTLDCLVPNYGKVHWYRGNNLSLPEAAFRDEGKLIIPRIKVTDSGMYICLFGESSASTIKKFFVTVRQITNNQKSVTTTDNLNYFGGSEANIIPCNNDTLQDAGMCRGHVGLFKCNDGSEVSKLLRCNRKKDCSDGSDELNCDMWPPKITQLPKPNVELFCGTKTDDNFEMLELKCEFAGSPEPSVKWKKSEGHVPSKCQQITFDGSGILRCPKFEQADQGAYSCIAENLVGSSESQPKSVAKCKNSVVCHGFRVKNEEIEHCLECFCSRKTNKCQNIRSKPFSMTIPFPDDKIVVHAKSDGKIVYIPSENDISSPIESEIQEVEYCELKSDGLNETSLLKSYGRSMQIPRYSGFVEFVPDAPDLIIQGSGGTIFYKYHVISPSSNAVNVRFWPGNWHHLNKTTATREDIMAVLSNVERFLFRCKYKKDNTENWSKMGKINLESSAISEFSKSVGYIEKCTCPEGYAGLSCESCATGYKRKILNLDFVCEKIQCNSSLGYFLSGNGCVKSPCSINGSMSLFPDTNGKCKCKEGMSGDTCNVKSSCEEGYFREDVLRQCLECWCSGVTNKCNSSTLHRTEISSMSLGGYNSSNGRNFWLLPPIFSGNRLTSYGGHIKYALRYSPGIPKQTKLLSVEVLSVNGNIFSYTHPSLDRTTTNNEKTLVIPLTETYWKKADKTPMNRSEFLNLLTGVKAIYIEAPYHLTSGQANLSWIRMSDAKKSEGTEFASQVEHCFCPPGYIGLSCESCDVGYYRNKITNLCVRCDCDNCDPVEGCLSCPKGYYLSNTSDSKLKPDCKPCDCSGREEKCALDNNNILFCVCQPGFTGLKCENVVPSVRNSTHLTANISPSKLTNIVIGSPISFNCSYNSGEELQISFMKIYSDKEEGPLKGVSNPSALSNDTYWSNSTFSIELDEDLLQVGCLIHNLKGREVGRVLAVIEHTELEPVKITNCYSDILYVKEGKSTDLICQTAGSPKPVSTWYIHKANNSREKLNSIDGVHSIEAVSMSQNATFYTCEAENIVGDKDTCSILLIVQENCHVVHIVPKFLTVDEGENINLKCRTSASTRVSWLGPKTILPHLKAFQQNGTLTIANSTIEDAGKYTCQTVLPQGKVINQTATVIVIEKLIPPTAIILEDDVMLEKGDNFEVKCEGNGKPTPTVTWRKSSGTVASNVELTNGILKIKAATLENSGIYECETQSKAGKDIARILIIVQNSKVAPKVKVEPNSLLLIEGKSARVKCTVLEGNPTPTLIWSRERNHRFEEYQQGELLEFKNITRNDIGIYRCQGHNLLGHHEAIIEINVMFLPNITTSKEEIEVLANEEITVKCSAIGNPVPILTWKNELKGDRKRNLGKNDVLASLYTNPPEITITLKASNALSRLICEATNEVGTATKAVPIKILPEFTFKKEDKHLVPIGSYHEFLCYGCTGKLIWERVGGRLIGDECEIPSGLMIPSVQIQHNATYVCKCTNDRYFKKLFGIIVSGFVPKFTQNPKSYIVLPVMLKSNSKFGAEISFKANKEDGLLLKDENNEFALYLENNKIVTILHSANKKRHHFTSTMTLKLGVWYTVVVDVVPDLCKVTIYDENSRILEEKVEHLKTPTVKLFSTLLNNFFIGGSRHRPKNVFAHHSLPSHVSSFDGCISRLIIDNEQFDLIRKGSYSSGVSLCKTCSKEPNLCKGMGKCFDAPTQFGFICVCPEDQNPEVCPPGCVGRNCNNQEDLCNAINPCFQKDLNTCSNKVSSLSCRCSFGYSGSTCEKKDLSMFCVERNGYVKISSNHLHRHSLSRPESIELSLFLRNPNGLIMWRGDSVNYAAITVNNRKVQFEVRNQGVKIRVVGDEYIHLLRNYTLLAKRMNDSISLRIDSNEYHEKTKFFTNRIKGDVYLGGAPIRVIPYDFITSGLNGCIFNVTFGESKINFHENVLETLNLTPFKTDRLSLVRSESNGSLTTESEEDEYESSGYDEFSSSSKQFQK